jgi:hypothetical protein
MKARATKALEVLKAGGYFRCALETGYHGGEKFHYRLRNAAGGVVKGYGFATYLELSKAGLLRHRPVVKSSTWPSEWDLGGV